MRQKRKFPNSVAVSKFPTIASGMRFSVELQMLIQSFGIFPPQRVIISQTLLDIVVDTCVPTKKNLLRRKAVSM